VQANKEKKAAQSAAAAARKRIEGISSANPFAEEQVSDRGYKMAMNTIKSQASQGLQALQGAGAESLIGGVGNLTQGVKSAALETGAGLAQEQANLSQKKAEAQLVINRDKEQRLNDLYTSDVQGAGAAAAQAQLTKNQGIEGIYGSIGSGLAAGLGGIPLYNQGDKYGALFGTPDQITTPEV
jgi:hypothetical protein